MLRNNTGGTTTDDDYDHDDHEPDSTHVALFRATAVVSALLSLVAIVGNAMVLYIGSRRRVTGSLRHLNSGIRSLAVTDFLIGLAAVPTIVLYTAIG